jgi:hypothetical protein
MSTHLKGLIQQKHNLRGNIKVAMLRKKWKQKDLRDNNGFVTKIL